MAGAAGAGRSIPSTSSRARGAGLDGWPIPAGELAGYYRRAL